MAFSVVTAGEYIGNGVAVAINSSGYAIPADPFSADRSRVVGISDGVTEAGSRVRIVLTDYAAVSTAGLTLGKPAYLSIHGSGILTTDFNNVASGYIEFCNETNNTIGLIPSRRQVEWNGGYVNKPMTPNCLARYFFSGFSYRFFYFNLFFYFSWFNFFCYFT